jgi:hypothetical protein
MVSTRRLFVIISRVLVALAGAVLGALAVYFGLNFRWGSWFLSGSDALIPCIIGGAVTALLIQYSLRRA